MLKPTVRRHAVDVNLMPTWKNGMVGVAHGSTMRTANLTIDVDRPNWIALLPVVLENYKHTLIDQWSQVGIRAAAFLYRRNRFRLECRTIGAIRFGVHERVPDSQSQSGPGFRTI